MRGLHKFIHYIPAVVSIITKFHFTYSCIFALTLTLTWLDLLPNSHPILTSVEATLLQGLMPGGQLVTIGHFELMSDGPSSADGLEHQHGFTGGRLHCDHSILYTITNNSSECEVNDNTYSVKKNFRKHRMCQALVAYLADGYRHHGWPAVCLQLI